MEIIEKKNKKMPINKLPFGSVIKRDNYYWIVVDKWIENNTTMIVNLDDGVYDYVKGEEVEVVEQAKLIIGQDIRGLSYQTSLTGRPQNLDIKTINLVLHFILLYDILQLQ